jgi:N-acetylglucosamine-6-phosphate deacetylase
MKCYSFIHGTVVTGGRLFQHKAVIVRDAKIAEVVDENELPADSVRIDLEGDYLAPGLIDVQLNGAGGCFFGGNPTPDGLDVMERATMQQGTTGFLATASTNTIELFRKMIRMAVDYRPKAKGNYLGLHLEGPYISPLSRGAHPTELIRKATVDEVRDLVELSKGEVKVITMAPELQSEEVIRYLDSVGVLISIGHSAASYDEAMHFLTGKKRLATHLYNGMQPMHHRKPGLIPAIFRAKPFTGIVADGIHVSFPMVRLAKQVLGESLVLITDGATPCTVGAYKHTFKGDRYVTVGPDGKETLSGSALTMLKAVQNSVDHVDIPLAEAINMATLYPAQALGMEDHLGQIRSGYDANIIVFDRDFKLKRVYFQGEQQC